MVSTWFTSGVHGASIAWLRPYGVTAGDLAVAALAALLFTAGALARRLVGCSSWIASGPGLALVGGWLLSTELARDVRWSLPALLLTRAAGRRDRRAAPPRRTVGPRHGDDRHDRRRRRRAAARRPRHVGLVGVGGAALIGLAVLVERTVNGEDGEGLDWRRLRQTWR